MDKFILTGTGHHAWDYKLSDEKSNVKKSVKSVNINIEGSKTYPTVVITYTDGTVEEGILEELHTEGFLTNRKIYAKKLLSYLEIINKK